MTEATTSAELAQLLRAHYLMADERRAGLFFTGVDVIADDGATRTADAVYLNLTRHARRRVEVCTLAMTRQAFVQVTQRPAETNPWLRYSSHYWLVVPTAEVADLTVLPAGWGVMCPQRFVKFKELRRPTGRDPQVDLALLLSLARRMDAVRVQEVQAAQEATASEYLARMLQERSTATLAAIPATERARLDALKLIERQTGIRVNTATGLVRPGSGQASPEQFVAAFRTAMSIVQTRDVVDKTLEDSLGQSGLALRSLLEAQDAIMGARGSLTDIGTDQAEEAQ